MMKTHLVFTKNSYQHYMRVLPFGNEIIILCVGETFLRIQNDSLRKIPTMKLSNEFPNSGAIL